MSAPIKLNAADISCAQAQALAIFAKTMREIVRDLLEESSAHEEGIVWEVGERMYPELRRAPAPVCAGVFGALVEPVLVAAIDAVLHELGYEPEYAPMERRFSDPALVDLMFVAEEAARNTFVHLMQIQIGESEAPRT